MVIRQVLGLPLDRLFRIQVPNAGITRVRIDHGESGLLPVLVFHSGQL
jgi:alpha-ribazole phosphatase/probable phosphoglycerate mutase